MITCAITNRHALQGESLLDSIARNIKEGMNWVQIREKDLTARELYDVACAARALPNPHGTKLIVNSRVDVAIAAGIDGVHLPADSPDAKEWRSVAPEGFLFGASCHNQNEAVEAASNGSDYIFYGPVFEPRSKSSAVPPRGLAGLAAAANAVSIPVLAVGGITPANAEDCLRAGAAGVAGISLGLAPFLPSITSC